jgi:hypothetical protein
MAATASRDVAYVSGGLVAKVRMHLHVEERKDETLGLMHVIQGMVYINPRHDSSDLLLRSSLHEVHLLKFVSRASSNRDWRWGRDTK